MSAAMVPLADVLTSPDVQAMTEVNLGEGLPTDLLPGTICYLRAWVRYRGAFPQVPYVLVSNYTDRCVEGEVAERILNDPLCQRWFAVNATMTHPKLTALPFGLRAVKPLLNVEPQPRELLCYANFRVHCPWRETAWAWATQQPWVTCQAYDKHQLQGFLQAVARSRFVLCPEGHGPDTFRLWEVLALGAIPVIQGHRLRHVLEGLPVFQVETWDHLSPFLLQKLYEGMQRCLDAGGYRLDRLTRQYWQHMIRGPQVRA